MTRALAESRANSAARLRTELTLEALQMPVSARDARLAELFHRSERCIKYTVHRYTERLAEAGT